MGYFIKLKLIEELDENAMYRTELALALEISERAVYNTVRRYLEDPISNCPFTKIAAIKLFQSKGLTEDQILTKEKPALP